MAPSPGRAVVVTTCKVQQRAAKKGPPFTAWYKTATLLEFYKFQIQKLYVDLRT
jgi:hypothetical protein